MAFGAAQGIIEHYADAFPTVAAIGPMLIPFAIGMLGMHYYYAAKVMNMTKVYAGLAAHFLVLVASKGMEWGFPKDTVAEQIEALTDDDYVLKHAGLHIALLPVLGLTCMPFITGTLEDKTVKKN